MIEVTTDLGEYFIFHVTGCRLLIAKIYKRLAPTHVVHDPPAKKVFKENAFDRPNTCRTMILSESVLRLLVVALLGWE